MVIKFNTYLLGLLFNYVLSKAPQDMQHVDNEPVPFDIIISSNPL